MAVSFIGAGTSSATNGSAPAPIIHASTVIGDFMVAVFYSREVTDGTVSLPAGWTQVVNQRSTGGLLGIWYRFFQSGDTAPTFTLGGHATGNSGDSAIAQIATWRGVDTTSPISVTGTIGNFASAQNIGAIVGVTSPAGGCVIVVAGKADDWTSVATLSGDSLTWNEVGEPDTTSGLDAGMVWDYALTASSTAITNKTFTVTGGAANVSKGVMIALAPVPPRRGQVSWAELETPDVVLNSRGQVSFAELEAPTPNSRTQLSFAEFETPNPDSRTQLSFAELEAPNPNSRVQLSFTEFEAPTPNSRVGVSYAEFETPTPPSRVLASFAELEAPNPDSRAQLSFVELEAPQPPSRLQASFAEFETPTPPSSVQLSFAEFETGTPPRRAHVSFAELETPVPPRRVQVAFVEFEAPNPSSRVEVSFVEFETPAPPRRAQISQAELETPQPPSRGLVSWSELQTPDEPRRALLSYAELETGTPPRRAEVSFTEVETPDPPDGSAVISWACLEVPHPKGCQMKWAVYKQVGGGMQLLAEYDTEEQALASIEVLVLTDVIYIACVDRKFRRLSQMSF